jgi:hypothetical protein
VGNIDSLQILTGLCPSWSDKILLCVKSGNWGEIISVLTLLLNIAILSDYTISVVSRRACVFVLYTVLEGAHTQYASNPNFPLKKLKIF